MGDSGIEKGFTTSPNSTTSGGSSGKQVTLRYTIWDKNQEPAMQQIVAKLKETHPNIDVKVEITP